MTDEPVPLCVDCRHYGAIATVQDRRGETTALGHFCIRNRSPVTGRPVAKQAEDERHKAGDCGPEGLNWERRA